MTARATVTVVFVVLGSLMSGLFYLIGAAVGDDRRFARNGAATMAGVFFVFWLLLFWVVGGYDHFVSDCHAIGGHMADVRGRLCVRDGQIVQP